MNQDKPDLEAHLRDAELFALAVPATGEPEALPRHLSRCSACSRALQEWKRAVRLLAVEQTGEIDRRSPEEWRAAEQATMAAIRRAGNPGRKSHPLRWAVGVAAALLAVALVLPGRRGAPVIAAAPTPLPESASPELSAADRADDELLRDVSALAEGGDAESDAAAEGRL